MTSANPASSITLTGRDRYIIAESSGRVVIECDARIKTAEERLCSVLSRTGFNPANSEHEDPEIAQLHKLLAENLKRLDRAHKLEERRLDSTILSFNPTPLVTSASRPLTRSMARQSLDASAITTSLPPVSSASASAPRRSLKRARSKARGGDIDAEDHQADQAQTDHAEFRTY
ncbi:hypothetical protein EYR40_005974 [Pleurotus pulmonarius]|nr:hypothetical protein EYR36_005640 [Pleurotus pulmonarius]KAF4602757.1 hypothetical protein EYR40_005974 [Pleurotus pulmonarius]